MPRLKQKALFAFLALISLLTLASPSPTLAQNKCGVNVGPNYGQVNQVKELTGQGGWIVALGTPGDCASLESLFGKGLNVVIRAYNGGKAFSQDHALAWVATLGSINSQGQKIYFMPWNEPNHHEECGGRSCSPDEISTYIQFLENKLSEAGLLGTKVELLSPMIDKLHPRFEEFKGIYSLTNASAINEYDQFSPGPCSAADPRQNNCQYNQIGIPAPYYAIEAGVTGTCSDYPCYKDDEVAQMLKTSWPKWQNDSNFKMFAVFSYDPHRPGSWNIFSSSQTKNFYQNSCFSGEVAGASFNQNVFEDWLNRQELVKCDNGCGWATSKEYCQASEGTTNQSPGIGEETIVLRDSLVSTNYKIQYSHKPDPMVTQIPLTPTPNPTNNSVLGDVTTKEGNFEGEIYLEEQYLPKFSGMNQIITTALEKLLPQKLKDSSYQVEEKDLTDFKLNHFIYGLDPETGEKIPESEEKRTPYGKTDYPAWWTSLIGRSKIACGLFGTCQAPQSLNIRIKEKNYEPVENLGTQKGKDINKDLPEETKLTEEGKKFFLTSWFKTITEIAEEIVEFFKRIIITKEEEAFFVGETRGIVPGGETINQQVTSLFQKDIPNSLVEKDKNKNAPLSVDVNYQLKGDKGSYSFVPGFETSEKAINYHQLGKAHKYYCLNLCNLLPSGVSVKTLDDTCLSCNPDDYEMAGYGDIPLSQEFCNWEDGVGCHYYDPNAVQGCEPGQDPICEGEDKEGNPKCNPYEFYTDNYISKCNKEPWYGNCRDPNVCYLMTFAPNPAGGYGECQYANPQVCVRADRLKVGKCIAVCNMACCAEQK